MHPEALPPETLNALTALKKPALLPVDFLLGGGTALALQIGHRLSNDLDFFSQVPFSEEDLTRRLVNETGFRLAQRAKGTVGGWLGKTWLSFLYAPFPLLDAPVDAPEVGTRLLSLPDIAAMKVLAVAQRGSRRDFVDLFVLHHQAGIPLERAVAYFQQKYTHHGYDLAHVLRALGYWEDAEAEPLPRMLQPLSWKEIRAFFASESRRLMRHYLKSS